MLVKKEIKNEVLIVIFLSYNFRHSKMSAEAAGPRKFEFPSHQSHLLTLAKMCKESKEFTDCIIQCDEGDNLKAHRLVLGSASSFLKTVFQDLPTSLAEATIVVPGVKRGVRRQKI